MRQSLDELMLATMKSINAFHLLSPSVQKVFSQDILGAMKALGLNPGEQEVVDMTNEVSLHHEDDDDDDGDDDDDDGDDSDDDDDEDDEDDDDDDDDDDDGEQEVVDMRNELSLDTILRLKERIIETNFCQRFRYWLSFV